MELDHGQWAMHVKAVKWEGRQAVAICQTTPSKIHLSRHSIPTVSCIVWAECLRFPLYECQAVGVPHLCFSIHRAVSGKVIAARSGGKGTDKLKPLLNPLRADFKCAGCGPSLTQLCDLAQCA